MNSNLPLLTQQAIQASLSQRWLEAIDLNLQILQQDQDSIPALNRLAKAYEESGEPSKALKHYRKVLKLDKYNHIAQNNLARLQNQKDSPVPPSTSPIIPFDFIEEPGKTKTISLTKLASKQILSQLRTSTSVKFKTNKRQIGVTTHNNIHIGYLPDDLALHLLQLIKLGNKYEAAIRSITPISIEIFIRETKRSSRLKGLPSFPLKDTKKYYQFLPAEPISETPLEIPTSDDIETELFSTP